MRPYLAIMIDSFREAFASRVLWILFILTTLWLAAIAPLSMVEQRATEFQRSEIRNWPEFISTLVDQGTADETTPGKRTWELLDKRIQNRQFQLHCCRVRILYIIAGELYGRDPAIVGHLSRSV